MNVRHPLQIIVGLLLVLVFLVGGLIVIANLMQAASLGTEIALPVLAISGVLVLLIGLGALAIAFALFQLSDRQEALGLPQGSVRAVIALALVLLFAILSVFLYGDLAKGGGSTTVKSLTSDQKDAMVKSISSVDLVAIAGPKADDPNKGSYEVTFRAHNAASEDFAKQLLVMIGTLVTAVASFYFGAKTATGAADGARGGPNAAVRAVTPNRAARGQGAVKVQIQGSGLNDIVKVSLRMAGAPPIATTDVTSADAVVNGTVTIDGATPTGAWDVVVTDKAGNETVGAALFTVTGGGVNPAPGGGVNPAPGGGVNPAPGGGAKPGG